MARDRGVMHAQPAMPPADRFEIPRLLTPVPGPRSLELAARLQSLESPDATCFSPEFPIFWKSARGSAIEDVDGNRYIDLSAGFGAAILGHSHPALVSAIRRQSELLIHGMGDVHPTEIRLRLADEIVRRVPGLTGGGAGPTSAGPTTAKPEWKVIFGVTGSDAIEAALKTAIIATGRPGVLSFEGAYHGLSLGALAVTQWPKFRDDFHAVIPDVCRAFPFPDAETKTQILENISEFLESREGKTTGAVLMEPIPGRGGVVPLPAGFLRDLRQICGRRGVLLILDEILTGFGRCGDWFACEAEGVAPDIIVAGKALGGGLPISVCIGRSEIIDRWGKSEGEARHTSTYVGHPLSCAAALAVLETIEKENLIAAARDKGGRIIERLRRLKKGNERIHEVRGRGMMIGIEFRDPSSGKPDRRMAGSFMIECLRQGVIVLTAGLQGNVVSLTPALTIDPDWIDIACEKMSRALERAERNS